MFFGLLGKAAAKRSLSIILIWAVALLIAVMIAPPWTSVIRNGEFAFLPDDSPSRIAEQEFLKAFPDDMLASSLVLVVRRETVVLEDRGESPATTDGDSPPQDPGAPVQDGSGSGSGAVSAPQHPKLLESDREFISRVFVPDLFRIVGLPIPSSDEEVSGDDSAEDSAAESRPAPQVRRDPAQPDFSSLVHEIQWFEDRKVGDLLVSENGQASLVVVRLRTEFLDQANAPLVDTVEQYLEQLYHTPFQSRAAPSAAASLPVAAGSATVAPGLPSGPMPAGLDITIAGTATFGRDMMRESQKSARATERWTVILVVLLLIIVYRAPLLALVPLATVAVSTSLTIHLLAVGASRGWLSLFNGIETYVTVVVYGAGIDYGLFLMARYREELDDGATLEEAVTKTLQYVGPAIATSAGTSIFGIGMMVFAEFGKFRQAGVALTFGLTLCLLASVTLTPAILRLLGRWAFWPNVASQSARGGTGFLVQNTWANRLQRARILEAVWERMGHLVEHRPGLMWLISLLGMFPFAVIGVTFLTFLSYGLLSELPDESASVRGTAAVQQHFPAGEIGPVSVRIEVPGFDFRQNSLAPEKLLQQLTTRLEENSERLGLHSIRSLSAPKGSRRHGRESIAASAGRRKLARDYYVSKQDSSVTRLDLIFRNDPFSQSSIDEFRRLRAELPALLPEELKGARISLIGPTANISDLKDVTDRDQIRIDLLVLISVYIVLVILLRRPGICVYLILSVFYSYFATLGFTFFVFWAADPAGFSGIDWKVPLFLFTIMIAVGEDYNIFLMTRIDEEQKVHGAVRGITVALERTGSIISSCGIIMAGSFISLMAGSLVGMDQLGLALAVGMLLDTFVVRPVMVPAFLVLLVQGRVGLLSRLAGHAPPARQ